MRTRGGVERRATGDADVLGEMMHSASLGEQPNSRRRPVRNKEEEEEGTTKTQQESCDEEEIAVEVENVVKNDEKVTKKPLRTRRGVQRQSTGDSEQLGLMLYGLAKSSGGGGVPTEISTLTTTEDAAAAAEPRRRGRRKTVADDSSHVDDSSHRYDDDEE